MSMIFVLLRKDTFKFLLVFLFINSRNKIYNYFSVMVRKRLKAEGDAEEEEGEKLSGGKLSKKKCK